MQTEVERELRGEVQGLRQASREEKGGRGQAVREMIDEMDARVNDLAS